MGLGTTRIHASVITPSAPSEPSTSASGEGPAPLDGKSFDCHTPRGVSIRVAAVSASMRV
jgi:hypothetical protein